MIIPLRFLAVLAFAAGSIPLFAEVHSIGNRKQIFIDHRFIEQAEHIELRMNPPVKHGVVMAGDNPWEDGLVTGAGTVLEDGGKFRCWYTAMAASPRQIEDNVFHICYAESVDGLHWAKPNLGLYEWDGSRANNIVMESEIENGGGVFIDPTAPPEQRYKLLGRVAEKSLSAPHVHAPDGSGLYLFTSGDGLHWRLHPHRVFPFSPDTVNMALYDDRTHKYLAFVRTWIDHRRRVGVVETNDILSPWPYEKKADATRLSDHARVPSTEIPEAFGADRSDSIASDHYTSAVVHYPWADDAYFMFPSFYRHFPNPPEGALRNDGPLDIQMAVSRDGRKYHRVTHFPYIENGLPRAADCGSMYMYIGMLRRSDEIYQYYGGFDWTHGAYHGFPETKHRGAVMMVSQRLDGFVSAEAGDDGGQFVTPALTFTGRSLKLNVEASASGQVLVELREADGTPIAGYAFGDGDPIYDNSVAKMVTWRRGKSDVATLAGRPVRIAFKLQTAKLYAFQFVE